MCPWTLITWFFIINANNRIRAIIIIFTKISAYSKCASILVFMCQMLGIISRCRPAWSGRLTASYFKTALSGQGDGFCKWTRLPCLSSSCSCVLLPSCLIQTLNLESVSNTSLLSLPIQDHLPNIPGWHWLHCFSSFWVQDIPRPSS